MDKRLSLIFAALLFGLIPRREVSTIRVSGWVNGSIASESWTHLLTQVVLTSLLIREL